MSLLRGLSVVADLGPQPLVEHHLGALALEVDAVALAQCEIVLDAQRVSK